MAISWRPWAIFAIGAAVGALFAGGLALSSRHDDRQAARQEAPPEAQHDARPRTVDATPAAGLARPAPSTPVAAVPCPSSPLAKSRSAEDGKFEVLDSISDKRAPDVAALIVIGKEAAAAGRARDAEVAFIMACRVATQLEPGGVALADAKYELGWHYGNLARDGAAGPPEQFAQRARAFYGEAWGVYTARLGRTSEKTRFAEEGLASLDTPPAAENVAVRPPPPPAAAAARPERQGNRGQETVASRSQPVAPAPRPQAREGLSRAAPVDTRVSGAGAAPVAPRPAPAGPRPSFDCAKARSTPQKLICGDPQLAQLDRELGRLYAQAKAGAADPARFRRHSDAQWRRREAICGDRECLLAWYAQRRAELLDDLGAQRGGQLAPTASAH
jgi:hypothetical protein